MNYLPMFAVLRADFGLEMAEVLLQQRHQYNCFRFVVEMTEPRDNKLVPYILVSVWRHLSPVTTTVLCLRTYYLTKFKCVVVFLFMSYENKYRR